MEEYEDTSALCQHFCGLSEREESHREKVRHLKLTHQLMRNKIWWYN
jgi:hypothetical protein